MQSDVFGYRHHLKILDSIVERVLINVMNYFSAFEFPPEMLLHHPPVFTLRDSISHYHPITVAEGPRMMRSLSEGMRVTPLLPATEVFNTITFHVMRRLTLTQRAFTAYTFFVYKRISVLLKRSPMPGTVTVTTRPNSASDDSAGTRFTLLCHNDEVA